MNNPHIGRQLLTFRSESIEVHAANVEAGWWSDLATGESIVPTRNRGELMMLMVSELSEASEGAHLNLFDDKLPHRRMLEVELADAKIRILDAGGADRLDFTSTALELIGLSALPNILGFTVDTALMHIVNQISRAMESNRKKNAPDKILPQRSGYEVGLTAALILIHELAFCVGMDIDGAVAEKRAFNANREDHKVENRKKAGGKQY